MESSAIEIDSTDVMSGVPQAEAVIELVAEKGPVKWIEIRPDLRLRTDDRSVEDFTGVGMKQLARIESALQSGVLTTSIGPRYTGKGRK